MEIEFKEVNFEKYCEKCKYSKEPEKEDMCNECLAEPMNSGTERPANWKGEK